MSDDRTQRGGQDRSRINLAQEYEVRDWADRFGVSEEELRRAVAEVGDRADAVESFLTSRH